MDVATIIAQAGGRAAVARETGSSPNTVLYWERRGRIPAAHWESIVRLTADNTEPVTWKTLASMRRITVQHASAA